MRRHETERSNSWNRSQRDANPQETSRDGRYTKDHWSIDNRDDRYDEESFGSAGDYSIDGVRFGNRDRDDSGSRFSEGSEWNRSRFADSAIGQYGARYGRGDHDRFERSRFERYDSGSGHKTGSYNRDFSHFNSSGARSDMGLHAGKGPKGYKRSDDRIKEEVCEALSRSPLVDASEIEVSVEDATVTLTGTVESRAAKREAENCIDTIYGVEDVHNEIRIRKSEDMLSKLSSQRKEGTAAAPTPSGLKN